MSNLFKVLLLVMFSASITACNTMEGAGKDIKAGGSKIENEAAEHK